MKSKIIAFMICLFSACLITQTVSASTINNDGEIGTAYRVVVYDLENESNFWENIETEHEKMFKQQNIKIKALIASLK